MAALWAEPARIRSSGGVLAHGAHAVQPCFKGESTAMHMRAFQFLLLLVSLCGVAHADQPLGPPERIVACSVSGAVCADSDPAAGRTVVLRKAGAKPLWSIAGWHRWLFTSNDGAALVVAYDGLNLIPADSTLQLEVLRFYNRGKLVRTVRLSDLYGDRSQL